ncbi:MAG: bifunctional glycosyltransferase family 2/GtrA family protein [Lachnospiraceae bacterium]|nr:bifunctional glycosyltransferase family 2/GtrA family protein [Lachnospiraceae bacterium]
MDVKRIALIPAYEPDNLLVYLVYELKKAEFEVVVVNDGSSKERDRIFKSCEKVTSVIEHSENLGKGVALKTGFLYIKNTFNSPYVVVTVDADGQHSVKDVIRACDEAEKYPDSLILGSRRFEKDVPLRSRLGNTVTRFVYCASSGVKINDTQTGLRAFSQNVMQRMLDVEGDRYEYEMNVLMYFAKEDRKIREICIDTIYLEGNRSSHFNVIKDSFMIYKEILKFSFSSFMSFIIDYILYCVLFMLSGQILFANVIARLFSASVNYTLNKKLVFESDTSLLRSAAGYTALAAAILVCNNFILKNLVSYGVNVYLAKIITETCMFAVSYIVQHHLIFGKGVSELEKA